MTDLIEVTVVADGGEAFVLAGASSRLSCQIELHKGLRGLRVRPPGDQPGV